MRKNLKEQLATLLSTLERAETVLRAMSEKRQNETEQLLADMQDSAIAIGEAVEESEGEGTVLVELLETYCELLWQCTQTSEVSERLHLCKLLTKKRRQAVNSLTWDIPTRYEAVFLPYKASMWDSLESVWLAAERDEEWDAYVVPIPYFDKNPNGTFAAEHYEIDQFPDNVPVIDYRNYSIADRQPDVIFIHNPYDGGNLVTSVHPQFYSLELKKYTKMLVYIPYFVVSGEMPVHFCTASGVVCADKVILQSEKVRQTYIQVFKNALELDDAQARKKGLYDKFVALGSPKIDKILSTRREDITLPKEWEEKIYGPMGGTV